MCAIAGILGPHDPALAERMCALMTHRGPDGEGFVHDPEARLTLGHKRLSILDPEHGAQPMETPDGSVRIVFNGEIFNAPGLRLELERRGRVFLTRNSDTEVLLHLYAEFGADMLERIMGMYAFCIHDREREMLLLARDRSGIKPLYCSHVQGRFAFASELKALTALPWISRDIDASSLSRYLALQFVPAPRSIFSGVKKLPAGHFLYMPVSQPEFFVRRHWALRFEPEPWRDERECAGRCRQALTAAVKRWSLSDVPIACSLSGGLDSSAIVGLLASGGHPGPLKTYSLGFSGPEGQGLDELDLARDVAAKWGTDHHELILAPEDLLDSLNDMVWSLDEPYGGGLPSWYVFKRMGLDVKVAMTGTGGDELFGNYGKWVRHERPVEEGLRVAASQTGDSEEGLRRLLVRAPHGALYHRYMTLNSLRGILRGPMAAGLADPPEALLERLWSEPGGDSPRDAVPRLDFTLQLPEEFLLMTDRFSMAHGVEARVPFLDEEMVDVIRRIPPGLRTRNGDYKYLLKLAVGDLLPPRLLDSPKRGFVLPLTDWTRGRLRPRLEAAFEPARLKRQGIFAPTLWRDVIAPHLEGKRDHTQQVWTLFMFQLWFERYVGD